MYPRSHSWLHTPELNHGTFETSYAYVQVTVKDAVVLATGCPITKNLIDSAVTAIAVHGKQYPKRR